MVKSKGFYKRIFLCFLSAAFVCLFGAWPVCADGLVSDGYKIAFYSGESNFSYYIDIYGNLYSSGNNSNGELGNGISGSVRYSPLKIAENIVSVADGKNGYALAIDTSGRVFVWGNNEYSQLGLGTGYNSDSQTNCVYVPEPVDVGGASKIVSAAAGESYSVLLDEDGKVFTAGRASYGQTGQPFEADTLNRKSTLDVFTAIDSSYFGNEKIMSISAALNACFALTESGKLYVWGANDRGILACGDTNEDIMNYTPVLLSSDLFGNESVKKVSACNMTAMALTESGKLYVWGDNGFGQFGISDFEEVSSGTPQLIEKFYGESDGERTVEIKDAISGGIANFALSGDGTIYSFGASGSGQTGHNVQTLADKKSEFVSGPNVIKPLAVVFYRPLSVETASPDEYANKLPVDQTSTIDVKIASFINSSGDRTFVSDSEGNTWSWGNNTYTMACSGNGSSYCPTPVRSTLYRIENYDTDYHEKNYIIKPAIVMSCVVLLTLCGFAAAEIKKCKLKIDAENAEKKVKNRFEKERTQKK